MCLFINRTGLGVLLGIGMVLGGCLSLGGGTEEPIRFYALRSLAEGPFGELSPQAGGLTLGVSPVRVPAYLQRPQIVTRRGENELLLGEFDRWAEPLEEGLGRVVADNLAALMPQVRVVGHPWRGSAAPDYRLVLELRRLEGGADGAVELEARWALLADDGREVGRGRFAGSQKVGGAGYGEMVEGMSRAVADLSREMAQGLAAVIGASGELN